jgi:cobalt-zinc-cadmium efflux system outer membrane protein
MAGDKAKRRSAPSLPLLWFLLLHAVVGCQTPSAVRPLRAEAQGVAALPPRALLGPARLSGELAPRDDAPLGLQALWRLAVAHSPSLREAEADVEAARGQQVQASKYPNPRFVFAEDLIGAREAPSGNLSMQITQEIVTGGKRRLDIAIAGRDTAAASLGLMSRKFEVMTRLRRAYYAYLGAGAAVGLHEAAVEALEKGVATTRQQVEATGRRTDLLRFEALLEETKISLARSRFNVEAAWKQVAAEVGVADLPMPEAVGNFQTSSPDWQSREIWERVKANNTNLRQALVEAERARLAVDRARAEAIPNITVGGGYANAPLEAAAGAVVTVEAPLPVWDRKQGRIREAQARWVKAQAAAAKLETNLSAVTAETFARYQGALRQVDKLNKEVLPRLQESVNLLLKGYEAGGAGVTFTDVLSTEQTLLDTRLKLSEARQALWQAVADLEGLMQVDIQDN